MRPRDVVTLGALLAAAACVASDPEARENHVTEMAERHAEARAELLAGEPLTLARCVELALARNLRVRAAELQARLLEVDADAAFSAFLPHVEASFGYRTQSEIPAISYQGQALQMTDKTVSEWSVALQQPIFTPQAWLLYGARKKGEDIGRLVLQRTRQLITLDATARYYACLALEAECGSREHACAEAAVLVREARLRREEGLLTQAALAEVELVAAQRDAALAACRRGLQRERARLLELLDLSPLAELELEPAEAEAFGEEAELADLVTRALLGRPELHVADRRIEARRDEVRAAVAAFLPNLGLSVGYQSTSDSFLVNPDVFALGLGAVLDVLSGFRKWNEHEAAQLREEAELLERDRAALAVILEVVEAHRQVRDLAAERELAARRLEVAELRLAEAKARREEGVLQESELLRQSSEREQARAALSVVGYRERVARATLRDAAAGYENEDAEKVSDEAPE